MKLPDDVLVYPANGAGSLPELSAYFAKDVEINRAGAPPLADVRPVALSPETVRAAAGTTLLDVRRDVGQLDPSRPTAAICAGE